MTGDGRVSLADVVNAASDILRDVETGALRASDVEARAEAVIREQAAQVNGPGDALWDLHGSIAREYLERGGMGSAEIAEWLAVQRRR